MSEASHYTTAEATAAPADISLAGETYRMSPLTDQDLGEIDRWLQSRVLDIARASITSAMTETERRDTMDAAMRHASSISMSTPEGVRVMNSLDGTAMLIWLGLRHNHPDLTRQQVREKLNDDRTIEAAMDRFDLLNDLGEEQKGRKKKASRRKTTRKKKAKKQRKKRSR